MMSADNLIAAANQLAVGLKRLGLSRLLKIDIGDPENTNLGGICVNVAKVRGYGASIELWHDFWPYEFDQPYPRFWVGFFGKSAEINKLKSIASKEIPTPEVLDYDPFDGEYVYLAGLNEGLPFSERFPDDFEYLGVYGGANEPLDLMRHLQFLKSILRSLPHYKQREEFPLQENRKVVRWHLEADRKAKLALGRKFDDDYRCEVCDFEFVDKYGHLGLGYAEAHHTVPLHKLKGPVLNTKINLVTVCSNCHRMLHRMDGTPKDVQALKVLINEKTKLRKLGNE